MAVYTSQPSLLSSVSAVRRMVLLSSMTSTLSPLSFDLPSTTRHFSLGAAATRTRFNISVSPPLMRTVHNLEAGWQRDGDHKWKASGVGLRASAGRGPKGRASG